MSLSAFARTSRLLGFARDLTAARSGRPFKLTFIVTDECSCRCAICHLWKAPRRGPDLAAIAAFFHANPFLSWINLSGGEVAERPDFAEIARAAVCETRCAALDFPTAGQRPAAIVDAARAALAAGVPRLFVTISIDGPPELHDALRGTNGAFERARETLRELRALRDRRLAVAVGVTFSSRNARDPEGLVSALLEAAPEINRSDLHFNLAHHAPHYYANREGDVPNGADVEALRAFFTVEGKRRGLPRSPLAALELAYWRLAADYLATRRTPLPCSALRASAYVDPEFTLYPCASWDRPLADLREHDLSLERALATTLARAAQEAATARECPNCWTPCEAYPMLLSQGSRALESLLHGPEIATPGATP